MSCNWSITDIILSVIIIVFALWVTAASKWVIIIAAAIILIHAIVHKDMHGPMTEKMPAQSGRSRKR